jgi:hypothetical protein
MLPLKPPKCEKITMPRLPTPILALAIVLACVLPGCFSTHLVPATESDALIDKLIASTSSNLPLKISFPEAQKSHGFQFIIGIIPFSRIFAEKLPDTLTAKLQFHAAKSGYGLTQNSSSKSGHMLSVNVDNLSLNGFDILVIRNPSASVSLTGTIRLASGRSKVCSAQGSSSHLAKFAFSPQLNHALDLALDSAAKDLLSCLGLVD